MNYTNLFRKALLALMGVLISQVSYATKCNCVCDFGEFDQEDTAVTISTATTMCSELNGQSCEENGLDSNGSGSLISCKRQKTQIVD